MGGHDSCFFGSTIAYTGLLCRQEGKIGLRLQNIKIRKSVIRASLRNQDARFFYYLITGFILLQFICYYGNIGGNSGTKHFLPHCTITIKGVKNVFR